VVGPLTADLGVVMSVLSLGDFFFYFSSPARRWGQRTLLK